VATGGVERGRPGRDNVEIVGIQDTKKSVITGIEMFRKVMDDVSTVTTWGSSGAELKRTRLSAAIVLAAPASITPHKKFKQRYILTQRRRGARHTPFFKGYRPSFTSGRSDITGTSP